MRLIQQSKLYYQEGNSDKVYEIDLCEINAQQYLVNFRYGKRGSTLREGTKTDLAVDRSKAENIFNKLVNEKKKKGYQEEGETPTTPPTPVAPTISYPSNTEYPGKRVLLQYLQEYTSNLKPSNTPPPSRPNTQATPKKKSKGGIWGAIKKITSSSSKKNTKKEKEPIERIKKRPLRRIIWRAAELKLTEAQDYILALPLTEEAIYLYTLSYALGRCCDQQAIPNLDRIINMRTTPAIVAIAKEAKMSLLSPNDQKQWAADILDQLPTQISSVINNEAEFITAINTQVEGLIGHYELIAHLYLISPYYPNIQRNLLNWAKQAPLKGGGYFQIIRQLFKTAEFKEDAVMYGALNYRVYQTKSTFSTSNYGGIYIGNQWVRAKEELKRNNSRLGFSAETRKYLQKRSWRMLAKKGQSQDLHYVKMATGILLAYNDESSTKGYQESFYKYERNDNGRWQRNRRIVNYKTNSNHHTFNSILYGNSQRFVNSASYQWTIAKDSENERRSSFREEAYPQLWDQVPQGLMHLLAESESSEVHEFAAKAAEANKSKIANLADISFIQMILAKNYSNTARFGLSLAKEIFDPANPNVDLLNTIINSPKDFIRQEGMEMIENSQTQLSKQIDFWVMLLFNPHSDVVVWTNQLFSMSSFSDQESMQIVAKSIAKMMGYNADATEDEKATILAATANLQQHFEKQLATCNLQIVYDLLDHPLAEVQVMAATILLVHETSVEELPDEILLGLINGETPELRTVGTQLLGRLSEEALLKKEDLLLALCLSPYAEVRQNVQPSIEKLAKQNEDFGEKAVKTLVPNLLKKEEHEGRDADLAQLLQGPLEPYLNKVDVKMVLKLIRSPRKAANEMGDYLLHKHLDPKDLTMRQIVRLSNSEIARTRQWCWNVYKKNKSRIKVELEEAVRIVDSKWDDSRDFAFDYFRNELKEKDWTPAILISICDSVNPPVQQFGKELIGRYFKEENGEQYLLQLSQHPTANLQQFATNYLEQYAAGDIKKLEELKPYIITVLSSINKSRVAKKRVMQFLHQEALKDKKAAQIAADIFTRQSLTMAITEKARYIDMMLDLKLHYPDIEVPLVLKEVRTYEPNN